MSVYKIYQVSNVKNKVVKEEVGSVTADSFDENFGKYSFYEHQNSFFGNLKSKSLSGFYDSRLSSVLIVKES
jgi:hypothetical protein